MALHLFQRKLLPQTEFLTIIYFIAHKWESFSHSASTVQTTTYSAHSDSQNDIKAQVSCQGNVSP